MEMDVSHLKIPQGYELTGEFRVPLEKEFYLYAAKENTPIVRVSGTNIGDFGGDLYYYGIGRFILRRKPVAVYTFRPTGEVRAPKINEWYQWGDGILTKCKGFATSPWPIYKMETTYE